MCEACSCWRGGRVSALAAARSTIRSNAVLGPCCLDACQFSLTPVTLGRQLALKRQTPPVSLFRGVAVPVGQGAVRSLPQPAGGAAQWALLPQYDAGQARGCPVYGAHRLSGLTGMEGWTDRQTDRRECTDEFRPLACKDAGKGPDGWADAATLGACSCSSNHCWHRLSPPLSNHAHTLI